MIQKHRIYTNIGEDQKVTVELNQDFDVMEILSLKFSQQQAYTSLCADYGVVCGRVSVNNGFGIPNAKVSIFVPLSDTDINDPVISKLYPYTSITDKDDNNYRYNLLPSNKQHSGHESTGTFPDQLDILTREEVLEVYEKYYKYTVKTNESGDFMIWGVPLGEQTLHIDIDLSDIGCFSLRPYDFIRQGFGTDNFKNTYQFKSSNDLDSLPQIKTFQKTITVYPFWGNQDLCEIGITRTDFDLSSLGVKVEPKAFLIGGTFTDTGKNSVNKNCDIKPKMGRKCDLQTKTGTIEAIRFTSAKDENNRPILEVYDIEEDIPEDGSFVLPLPMNMDYLYTNEFGETEITNDPNKGIPSSACYRFRFTLNDSGNERIRKTASYLVPNIREFSNDPDKSYSFSTNLNDYPSDSLSLILNNSYGEYIPQDYFYRFNYNKVYTVSSFQNLYFNSNDSTFNKDKFLGIKEISPSEEEDCSSDVLTPPVNFGVKNYTFTLLIADVLLTLDYLIKFIFLTFLNFLIKDILDPLIENVAFKFGRKFGRSLRSALSRLQVNTTTRLSLLTYPDCEECTDEVNINPSDNITETYCKVGSFNITGSNETTKRFITYVPLNTWTFVHNLGEQFPVVQVYDINDVLISPGNIIFQDNNTIVVTFSSAQTGSITATLSNVNNRRRAVNNIVYNVEDVNDCLIDATPIVDDNDFVTRQTLYFLKVDDQIIDIDIRKYFLIEGGLLVFNDGDNLFTESRVYNIEILDRSTKTIDFNPNQQLENGCSLYDKLYDENLATGYYVLSGNNRVFKSRNGLLPTDIVDATSICGQETTSPDSTEPPYSSAPGIKDLSSDTRVYMTPPLPQSWRSEFKNGVFYIVPGTQTLGKLWAVLREYKRRKRVGKLFCGGIVNYSFIDNWLSGSLYFFLFKSKKGKFCDEVIKYIPSDDKYYYKSTYYNHSNNTWGRPYPIVNPNRRVLGRPTTIVDLGPRDEFIKEICVDPTLDPNCSVARSIGSTTFKSFGELMGLAINYRMDVSNNNYDINDFFSNDGFKFTNRVFSGDLLQLISINNEVGIEEFDLQNPKYLGYNYQILDPDTYPSVFTKDGYWGPTPITFVLDEDGERVRLCLNQPTHVDYNNQTVQGRLTETSQSVPFFLWDKKGTGFGGDSQESSTKQSWDYSSTQIQPLQGMTYGYSITGTPNESTDKYLLLPMTNTFSGLTISSNVTTDIFYDDISIGTNTYTIHNNARPGFTHLHVTSGTIDNPITGILHVRYGNAGTDGSTGWWIISWNNTMDFIIPRTEDYYSGNKQILSTPFMFYFGLRPGKTGVDKFIDLFGPKGVFQTIE